MVREGYVAPRARIDLSYQPPRGDPDQRVELPLKILVMGDFTLRPDDRLLEERRPVEINTDSFDRVLAEQNLVLDLVVADARSHGPDAGRSVRLAFKRLADFTPEGVAGQVPDLLPAQVHEVLRDARFQELERAWRSLMYLVSHVDLRENVKVEALHCSKDDLALDFDDSPDVQRSGLYRLVYSWVFHTFGGQPYGLIVGNYAFDAGPQDLSLLEKIAPISEMAHAPFVAAAAPSMFGLRSWEELPGVEDVARLFDAPGYEPWRRFRDRADARYVALTLPRFLLRLPHAAPPVGAFASEVDVIGRRERCLWGNAAFALAARVADSFAKYRWCPNIIGPQDGAVEDLPMPPTECPLTERHEYQLAEEGFIGLNFREGSKQACFLSANSVQRAKYFGPSPAGRAAETTHRLGGRLPYLLMLTRLAHYFKVMARDRIGGWMERRDLEYVLNDWLRQHVADTDDPAPGVRGRCFLRRAVVKVVDVEGQPGWYRFDLQVQPKFDSVGMAFELSLVGKIDKE